MDPIDNWEQMNVLQRVTMLTALIDETKDKGVNTREAEGLMQLASNHIDSEEFDAGNQLLQKTYFSLKRIREQHLDDPTMLGGVMEQPPPPPPSTSGRPRPTKGRCTLCRGENLQFNEDGTGECPDCKRKFFWDRSMIPPPEPEVEKGEPEEAPVEGEIEITEVEQQIQEEAPFEEIIREEAPLVPAPPEPEPSVPADPIDQGIEIQETFPPMARPPPPPQEIDLMKVEDEKNLESVSIVVPNEEIPEDDEEEEEKPKDNFDMDDFFNLEEEGAENQSPSHEETPSDVEEPKPPEEEPQPPAEEEEKPPEEEAPKDLVQIKEEKEQLTKEREEVQARIKELEEQLGKGGE